MNALQKELESRLEALESRLAFQEDTLTQLSDTIALQDARIQTLTKQLNRVSQKYRDLRDALDGDSDHRDERPPHY